MRKHVRKLIPVAVRKRLGSRGAAMVEYSILLIMSVPIIAGIVVGGATLARSYLAERQMIR